MSNFNEQLEIGKTGESLIANWLKSRGNSILPIYEIADNQFKGPALYCNDNSSLVAPDMAVFGNNDMLFVEAKYKSGFSWYRNGKTWVTGIDLHHFYQYLSFKKKVNKDVFIFFLHKGLSAKDSDISESGLFGGEIDYLLMNSSHRSDKHGTSGMIYWSKDSLTRYAEYSEVMNLV